MSSTAFQRAWHRVLGLVCWTLLFFVLGLAMVYGLLAPIIRRGLILFSQFTAMRGLTRRQRGLLRRLWRWESYYHELSGRYAHGRGEVADRLAPAAKRADAALEVCRQAKIPEGRIRFFCVATYDHYGPFPLNW